MTRKTILAVALAALVLALAGCRRKQQAEVKLTEESGSPTLSSVVHMADAKNAAQLLSGFHDVEQNSWRWTAGKFSLTLRAPAGAAQKGAKLVMKFAIPDAVLSKVKSMTLAATVNKVALPPQTYSQAGDQAYEKDVPANAVTGEAVTVEFTLDKFLPAGAVDARELGVVASSIGLETK